MNIEDLIKALFGGQQSQMMTPEQEAQASAVLARRTGPDTIETEETLTDDEVNAQSSSPLRRRAARKNMVSSAFGER